jgi:hypothetical protein
VESPDGHACRFATSGCAKPPATLHVLINVQPKKPADVLAALVFGLATIVLGLVFWLGPVAYGVFLMRDGHGVLGPLVTTLGAAWAILLGREATLVGMLGGAVHTILIFAGLAKDPWEGER